MVSIIIPFKFGRYGDVELRYALRSIEKHLSSVGKVFIFGRAPSWCQNIVEIPTPDIDRNFTKIYEKERAIYEKVRLACYLEDVSDDFLFMNDDHFLLQDFDAVKFPIYWSGDLYDAIEGTKGGIYVNTLKNTLDEVKRLEILSEFYRLHYDCHCPILYNKKKFLKLESLDWRKKYGYAIKTMYTMINGVSDTQMCHDLKFRHPTTRQMILQALSGQPFFSTDDKAIDGAMVGVLKELYPQKSKYEKL